MRPSNLRLSWSLPVAGDLAQTAAFANLSLILSSTLVDFCRLRVLQTYPISGVQQFLAVMFEGIGVLGSWGMAMRLGFVSRCRRRR